jgi:cytochrome c556
MKRVGWVAICALLLGATSDGTLPLRARMKEKVNPAFTRLSYVLFHAAKPSDEELQRAAADLEQVSRELARRPLGSGATETNPQFRIYAVQLHTNSQALLTTVEEQGSRDELEHWFNHVRASCEACHSQFKEDTK